MARWTFIWIGLMLFIGSLLIVLDRTPLHQQFAGLSGSNPLADTATCVPRIIYDGDTFGCDFDGNGRIDGQAEHIRLIGVNSSEMHYSRKNHTGKDEPFALEATRYVESAILHNRVYLVYDNKHFDRYNRTLAYVYLDPGHKKMLNEMLLEKGLAKLMFFRPNLRYKPEFTQLADEARNKRLGLWSLPEKNDSAF